MEESGSAASVPASFKDDEYNSPAWHLVGRAILSAKNSLIIITSESVVGLK